MNSIYDFEALDAGGRAVRLSDFEGKVLLIINTASQCGFTQQYAGLQALHSDFQAQGLVVLGFPCNQFGAQEPGSHDQIAIFCKQTFSVSFPIFAKIEVNGSAASPLFIWLKEQAPGILGSKSIKWNFTKFLVNRDGQVVGRFSPTTTPASIRKEIETLLKSGRGQIKQ